MFVVLWIDLVYIWREKSVDIWDEFWNVHLLMTEFCYRWPCAIELDVKIHLASNTLSLIWSYSGNLWVTFFLSKPGSQGMWLVQWFSLDYPNVIHCICHITVGVNDWSTVFITVFSAVVLALTTVVALLKVLIGFVCLCLLHRAAYEMSPHKFHPTPFPPPLLFFSWKAK